MVSWLLRSVHIGALRLPDMKTVQPLPMFFTLIRYLSHADQKQFIVATPFILLDNDHEEMANFYLNVLEKEAMKEVELMKLLKGQMLLTAS